MAKHRTHSLEFTFLITHRSDGSCGRPRSLPDLLKTTKKDGCVKVVFHPA